MSEADLRQEAVEWSVAYDRANRADTETDEALWRWREFVAVQRIRRCVGQTNTASFYDDVPRWYQEGTP